MVLNFLFKAFLSGFLIASISLLAQFSKTSAALLAAFPLTSSLALLLIYMQNRDASAISGLTLTIFLITLPSLSFFLILRAFLKQMDFYQSFFLSIFLTLAICFIYVKVMGRFFPQILS